MLVKHLFEGMRIGQIEILNLRRERTVSHVTFTDGTVTKTLTLHKVASFTDATLGPLASASLDRRTMERVPVRVRAHSPEWRGENRGERGDRFISRNGSWDRATLQVTPRA